MRKTLILVTALITGCATTEEFMAEPPDAVVALTLPPEQAALCMARNMERKSSGFITDRRPGTTPGEWELIIRSVDMPYAVARLQPIGTGSQATIWTGVLMYPTQESTLKLMTAGC